jgi:hypothetical protein
MARTKRFKHLYPHGFEPMFYPEAFLSPLHLKRPSRIGVCFMGDIFGDWIDPQKEFLLPYYNVNLLKDGRHIKPLNPIGLRDAIFRVIERSGQHTFIFLTKCPWNLAKWSPFPQNCQVGATVTNQAALGAALAGLAVIDAKVKFLSFEPLLGHINILPPYDLDNSIQWIIIGSATHPYRPPKVEWVYEIVRAADKAGIAVFLKSNLMPLFEAEGITKCDDWTGIRQEVPDG